MTSQHRAQRINEVIPHGIKTYRRGINRDMDPYDTLPLEVRRAVANAPYQFSCDNLVKKITRGQSIESVLRYIKRKSAMTERT